MNFDEFINKYNGRALDYDKAAGVQCVDLIMFYLQDVFGLGGIIYANARDYYEKFNNYPVLKNNFDKIPNTPSFIPKKGDIVVWGEGIGKYGHIAIATGEGNTSQFYTYDMNWNGRACKKVLHGYKGVLGVLRAKEQHKISNENSLFWVRVNKEKACVRIGPNTASSLGGSKYLYRGNTFQANRIVEGEDVSGNNKWYRSWKGNYVWSGGLTRI